MVRAFILSIYNVNQIITLNLLDNPDHPVNARKLHGFLESKQQFADWIKNCINEYGFFENQDYILVSKNYEIKGRGGDRRSIDYFLTLDMAKELSMVERLRFYTKY